MSEHKQDERTGMNTGAPLLAGKYEILEDISRGGFGRVLKVRQVDMDKIFAAKIIIPDAAGPEGVKRLVREGQILNKLKHPNLVEVYSSVMDDRHGLVLVMQYIEGKPLSRVLPLPVGQAVDLAKQICSGLQCAHDGGVLHRDLKPSNVMVVEKEEKQQAIIIDFGIAKGDTNQKLTSTGAIIGTPLYMSPEQFTGQKVDVRSEIYSFGCLFYEMLTGQTPFQGENPVELATKHHAEPVVPPSEVSDQVPVTLDHIVLKCLEKAPADRYESMAEILNDLQHCDLAPSSVSRKRKLTLAPKRKPWNFLKKMFVFTAGFLLLGLAAAFGLYQMDPKTVEANRLTGAENTLAEIERPLLADRPAFENVSSNLGAFERESVVPLWTNEKMIDRNRILKLLLRVKEMSAMCELMKHQVSDSNAARQVDRSYADASSRAYEGLQAIGSIADQGPYKNPDEYVDLSLTRLQADIMHSETHRIFSRINEIARFIDGMLERGGHPPVKLNQMRLHLIDAEINTRLNAKKDAQNSAKEVLDAIKNGDFSQSNIDEQVQVKVWTAYARRRLHELGLN